MRVRDVCRVFFLHPLKTSNSLLDGTTSTFFILSDFLTPAFSPILFCAVFIDLLTPSRSPLVQIFTSYTVYNPVYRSSKYTLYIGLF